MGDPDKADVSSIPDWWQLDHPEWTFPKGNVLHVNCNYQLLIDNILDQSHANYVHVATLGTQEVNDVPRRYPRSLTASVAQVGSLAVRLRRFTPNLGSPRLP